MKSLLTALLDTKKDRAQWYISHGFSKADAGMFAAEEIKEEEEQFYATVKKIRKKSDAKRVKILRDAEKVTKLISKFKKM
jgi:hypothetical protein